MSPLTIALLIMAGAASAIVLAQAIRRPILWRMSARNASRRPRQTATVIAGLMIGTAIISAAIVAGQSAGTAIRGVVYEALGDVDETVRLDAFNYFPEDVLHAYLDDPDIAAYFDGIAPNAIWDAAVTNPDTDLFEPLVIQVGFDPTLDADFRPFELTDGRSIDGSELPPGQAIITKRLADAIEAGPGDVIDLRYTRPLDPLIPNVTLIEGSITGIGSDILAGLGVVIPGIGTFDTPFDVDVGADSIRTVIGWDPRPAGAIPVPFTALSVTLIAPDGSTYSSAEPAFPGALPPLWLNVTQAEAGGTLPPGTWTHRVSTNAAVQTPFQGAAAVLYPVYDPAELQSRVSNLQDQFGGDESGGLADITGFDPFGDPEEMSLTVYAVTDGGRGEQFDFHEAVFFHLDEAQAAWGRDGQINVIKFSNPGDMIDGRAGTATAVALLNATLAGIQADLPDNGAVQALTVHPVKQDFIQLADDSGQTLTALLLFAGSLTVITGLLLIINIFTMLAEERRSELGMARAVGMSRRDLVRLFVFEGSLYAVVAAALGAIAGLGLAAIMVAIINLIIENLDADFPPIMLKVTLEALLAAFAAGTVLTFTTIALASRRISRLNIVRAIRRIDDPEKAGTMFQFNVGVGLALVGAIVAVAGSLPIDFDYRFSLQVFGPLLIAIGAGVALKLFIRRKPLNITVAGLLTSYYIATYFLISDYENMEEANIVGPIRGVLLTLGVVIIASYSTAIPRFVGRLMSVSKRLRAVALPAVSYPQHKRFRTGMTLAMFSIVILSIGFFSIFGGLFDVPPETQTGGFDIEATTTLDVEDLSRFDRGLIPAGTITESTRVVDFSTRDVGLITVSGQSTGQYSAQPGHHVYGIHEEFPTMQEFRLLWRLDGYDTDQAAYEALLEDDSVVIVAYPYSTNEQNQDLSHEVGEKLQIHLGDTPQEYTIIGIQEQYHFQGIWLGAEAVSNLFPTTSDSLYLYRLAPGVDAIETAKLLEQNYRDAGMDAEASREQVLEEQETFRQVLSAMKLFLGLGLIVGVLSLGIVTARSVIERRQEIGMLRALGFTPNMIRRIFLTEMTLVVVMGAIIGIACSIVVSFGLWYAIIRELQYPYNIPWAEIGWLVLVSYIVALAATIAPIRRAAKVAPAEALRYLE